jgi:hypothetical protein
LSHLALPGHHIARLRQASRGFFALMTDAGQGCAIDPGRPIVIAADDLLIVAYVLAMRTYRRKISS